jgi:hypothetical protein
MPHRPEYRAGGGEHRRVKKAKPGAKIKQQRAYGAAIARVRRGRRSAAQ